MMKFFARYGIAIMGVLFLTSAPVYAQTGGTGVLPGCSPEFFEMQQNRARAEVVRTMASAKQIINKPSSTNALTCFDQAMVSSAKAGNIFSDTPPDELPSFDSLISIGLGSAIGGPFGDGTGEIIGNHLREVVDPVLGNLLQGFVGALSSAISSTLTSAFSGLIGQLTSSIPGLGALISGLMGINMDCSIMQEVWDSQVTGQGLDGGYSHIPYQDLINQNAQGWATNAMAQLISNSGILDLARSDYENLSTPGYFDFNPISPIISPNATVQEVIQAY